MKINYYNEETKQPHYIHISKFEKAFIDILFNQSWQKVSTLTLMNHSRYRFITNPLQF